MEDEIKEEKDIKEEEEESEEEVEKEEEGEKEVKEKAKKPALKKNQELQAKYMIFAMGIIIIIVFASAWISVESKQFKYLGGDWQKEMFGQIPIYASMIQGYNVQGDMINFKLALKNDPRKLEYIPVEKDFKLITNQPVYFSLNLSSEIEGCDQGALISFGYFMAKMGLKVETSLTDQKTSKEMNYTYATCDNTFGSSVIILTDGEKDEIFLAEGKENCYVASMKDCNIQDVMERVEMAIFADLTDQAL